MDDEHHGEFDANELRQHEEFTKVKNVDSVELGQYQMETWYFSPLPAEYNNCKVRLPLTLPCLPRKACATCAGKAFWVVTRPLMLLCLSDEDFANMHWQCIPRHQ